MAYMISVEGEFRPDTPDLVVELFPQVDIITPERTVELRPVEVVNPPPPPPEIDVVMADRPIEDIGTIVGNIPEFGETAITNEAVNFNVADSDSRPIVRIPPIYPPRALERGLEGYCGMQFDVGTDGIPLNVRANFCTNNIFETNSIRAVERWRYAPRAENGISVVQRGITTQIDYTITN